MRKIISVVGLVIVAACTSPAEQCRINATKQLDNLNYAISETSANVGRGYAVHRQSVPYTYTGTCYDSYYGNYACPRTGYRTQENPVAVDVNQERQKLTELNAMVPEVKRNAQNGLRQCAAQYPEL